jgi:preprotein translocase subunit SecB
MRRCYGGLIMEEPKSSNLFPIQANFIGVRELHIKANRPPSSADPLDDLEPRIKVRNSHYEEEDKRIQVFMAIEIGKETDDENEIAENPFHLRIEIVGDFEVDEERFPKDKIQQWANINAPYVIYPYLREQVYSLTARCGFMPLVLPLLELPTIRIQKSDLEPATL